MVLKTESIQLISSALTEAIRAAEGQMQNASVLANDRAQHETCQKYHLQRVADYIEVIKEVKAFREDLLPRSK